MDVELNQLNRRKQASEALDGAGVVMDASQSQCPVEDANPAYRRITGYRVQEALGKPLNLFEGPDTDAAGVAELRAAIGKVTPAAMLLQCYRKDGTPFWNDIIVSPEIGRASCRERVCHYV